MSTYKSITHVIRVITGKTKKDGERRVTGWAVTAMASGTTTVEDEDALSSILEMAAHVARDDADAVDHRGAVTAIVAGYDLPYDLQGQWTRLAKFWTMEPMAKAPSDIYAIRMYRRGQRQKAPSVILWDLAHVTPMGVARMAEMLGRERKGTSEDDTRIMRAFILETQRRHHLEEDADGTDIGSRILTMTSLARHDSDITIGQLSYESRGRVHKLRGDYLADAARESARTYDSYAMRKASSRGGLAFVSARHACEVMGRTIGIDETSAHHAQVMRGWIPEHFRQGDPKSMTAAAARIVRTSVDEILESYHLPFIVGLHAEFVFTGLRPRSQSVWEHEQIGIESTARLAQASGIEGIDDEAAVMAEAAIRARGYGDEAEGMVTAFGKVMSARTLRTWMTEQELWIFSRAYEWDDMRVTRGEMTTRWKRPDDYAVLTSMRLFGRKQEAKRLASEATDPVEKTRLKAIYACEVKPQFNAVGYGLHARDEYRPTWEIDDGGEWHLGETVTPENFASRKPKRPKAWYGYGIRISGGSRMQLVIALELLWRAFGTDIAIIAGDTDSIKITTDIPTERILAALAPLHAATRDAIARTTSRAREMWPSAYRSMDGVGEFEVEDVFCEFYAPGVKQYVGISDGGKVTLKLAGVPREGDFSYAAWVAQMVRKHGSGILTRVFTFDVQLAPNVSQVTAPDEDAVTTDAEGHITIRQPRGVYYTLNDTSSADARASVRWLRSHGREVTLDPVAVCSWRATGAVFSHMDGEIRA